jgi:hypothetical protein
MDDFYEFNHECEAMPDGVRFLKIDGSRSSQFSVQKHYDGVALHLTTIYGFRFCPYCGWEVEYVGLQH